MNRKRKPPTPDVAPVPPAEPPKRGPGRPKGSRKPDAARADKAVRVPNEALQKIILAAEAAKRTVGMQIAYMVEAMEKAGIW